MSTPEQRREYRRQWSAKRIEAGICLRCSDPAVEGKRLCEKHRAKQTESALSWQAKNPDRWKEYYDNYRRENRERLNEYAREYRRRNKEKLREYQRAWVAKRRAEKRLAENRELVEA